MKKYFYSFIILASSLFAEIAEDDLTGIYKEATLFVVVGLVMSIVSYKISSKNAAKYASKNKKNIDAARDANKDMVKLKESRVDELSKMLNDGTITNDEFKMLKKRMYNTEV